MMDGNGVSNTRHYSAGARVASGAIVPPNYGHLCGILEEQGHRGGGDGGGGIPCGRTIFPETICTNWYPEVRLS